MPRLRKLPTQASDLIVEDDQTPPTEEIVIELADDDVGETVVELAPPIEKRPEPVVAPEPDADGALQRALQAQRRAEDLARTATANLAERDEELVRERTEREDAEYNSVLTSIAAEQSAIDKAESDYAAFAAAGDWSAASKAQREMAVAATRVDRLEDNKRTFDQRREAAKTAAPRAVRPTAQPQDFEQRLSALGLPEKAQGWLRAHPEFINDTSRNGELGAVHNYLQTSKRIEPFSQAYFDALDTEFGFKAPPQAEPIGAAPQAPRRSIPMSAPVSRDVPATSGQRPSSQSMTLTPDERAIARTSFTATDMTVTQKELLYAKNKAKLARERANGKYPSREQA